MTAAAGTDPTEQDMRAAYERCRQSTRTTWPDTYEAAMADPVLAGLVRLNAKHPPRAQRAVAAAPARHTVGRPLPAIQPPQFDRKRAAAGERDDD